jgi:enterochelin esterase family protein
MILPVNRTAAFQLFAAIPVFFLCVFMLGAQKAERPTPPTRDPHTPGYVKAKELPDGAVPPADVDGNFIIGPTHNPSPGIDPEGKIVDGTVV